MRRSRRPSLWLRAAPVLAFVGLSLLERLFPLRRQDASGPRRTARNMSIATSGAVVNGPLQGAIIGPLTQWIERRQWGPLQRSGLPAWAQDALAVLWMDYTLYLWHVLTHRVPALWRFHAVHHADRDLDASTALRFHFGELALSVPYRAVQVSLVGVGPRAFALWQNLLLLSILFHHSNLRLPRSIERVLTWVLVTPRLHGIHHSQEQAVRDSNWSSGLSLWDRLHGTFRDDVPQEEITIGLPEWTVERDRLGRMLALPFQKE